LSTGSRFDQTIIGLQAKFGNSFGFVVFGSTTPGLLERNIQLAVAGPRALTPHPGEMARMLGTTVPMVEADRFETVRAFCARHPAALLLKGASTIVGGPGGRVFVNPTGNPGMASGGSGDVLTGMVGAFLARGLDATAALCAGCFLHGRAGDLAVPHHGEEGLIAGDIIEAIGAAMMSLHQESARP